MVEVLPLSRYPLINKTDVDLIVTYFESKASGKEAKKMNEKQINLIMEIIKEQLSEYLADELTEDIMAGIAEGINDNMPLIEDLGVYE